MKKLANITVDEKDYQALLVNGAFLDIKVISVKIIPDDSEIKDDEIYKQLLKEYKKVRDKLETYRFEKTINK